MTHPVLEPELAAAYVRELSADVTAVVVLDGAGSRLAGSESAAGAAAALAALLPNGAVRTPDGLVVVASTPERTLVAVAGPRAIAGPTLLDAAAALGAEPAAEIPDPAPGLEKAARDVIQAT